MCLARARLVAMRFEATMRLLGNNTGIPVPAEVLKELGGGNPSAPHRRRD